jgi:hypothetical protein
MSLKENTLWDTRVLNSWLENMNGIVIKIVVQNTFSDSEVFVTILNNWFLEITVESQDLSVVLQPLWSDLGNGVLNLGSVPSDAGKVFSSWTTSQG